MWPIRCSVCGKMACMWWVWASTESVDCKNQDRHICPCAPVACLISFISEAYSWLLRVWLWEACVCVHSDTFLRSFWPAWVVCKCACLCVVAAVRDCQTFKAVKWRMPTCSARIIPHTHPDSNTYTQGVFIPGQNYWQFKIASRFKGTLLLKSQKSVCTCFQRQATAMGVYQLIFIYRQ